MREDAALHAVRDDHRMLRRGRCDIRRITAPIDSRGEDVNSTFFVCPMVGDPPDFVQLRLGVDRPSGTSEVDHFSLQDIFR